MLNKHLFITCMNNSGSTLLQHCLGGCKSVTELPRLIADQATSSEGHVHASREMPSPKKHGILGVWTEKPHIIRDDKNYNWKTIKSKWLKGWEESAGRPLEDMILLEKSPPNVLRSELLQKHFLNSHFIIMVRNPYAVSEGLRRRQGYKIERCATHWGESMKFQIRNLEVLSKAVWIRYEDLCDNHALVKKKIEQLLPELDDLTFDGKLSDHHSIYGRKSMVIKNLNSNQIRNLSKKDIHRINSVLSKYKKELDYFNYKMMEA